MAAGDELLIVDATERDREGMRRLFDEAGYVVTALADVREARSFVEGKFFPAAIVDLDVEEGALELIQFIRKRSEATGVVLLTGRRSFEAAVEALRLGVVDVVQKRPESVDRLRDAVNEASQRYRASSDRETLLREALTVLDDALRLMLVFVRKIYAETSLRSDAASPTASVMLVEADTAFANAIVEGSAGKDWRILVEQSGGSALDRASSGNVEVVVTRDDLPDLPGSMVARTIQAQWPKVSVLVYGSQGPGGHIDRWVDGRMGDSYAPFETPTHLLERLAHVADEVNAVRRERVYLQQFRRDHGEFLLRFSNLRRRIDTSLR